MTLILRGNTWHIRKTIKGIRLDESTKTSNKRIAEQIMAKRINEVTQEVVLAGKKPIKLHAAIDLFVKSRAHLPSAQNCEIHIRYFKSIPDKNLDRVTDEELDDCIATKRAEGYKDSTLKVSVTYFNAMINHCDEKGYTVRKKLKTLKAPAGKLRWLTEQEEDALFHALDPAEVEVNDPVLIAQRQENWDLAKLLSHTAARYTEIAHMKWTQVEFANNRVFIKRKKGSIDGYVQMTPTMKRILERRREMEKGEWLFSSKLTDKSETKWMNTAVKRAGLSTVDGTVTLHTLRHSTAVRLLQKGMNLVELQRFLGHKSISSTMVYAHVVEDDVARKAAAMRQGPVVEAAQLIEPAKKAKLRVVS